MCCCSEPDKDAKELADEGCGEDANPELDDMTRRFRVGVALTLPLLAVMVEVKQDAMANQER